MPEGTILVLVMDCCHSATVLDLPYKYKATGSGWGGASDHDMGYASGGCKCNLKNMLGLLALIVLGFVAVVTIHHFVEKSV